MINIKKELTEIMLKIDFPLLKVIIFESNPELCGNTYEVYKEMIKNKINNRYKFIWLVENKKNYKRIENIYYINYGNNIYEKLLRRLLMIFSKAIIFENRLYNKRWKNQYVFNLTHGMPLKLGELSYIEHDTCDYIFSSSAYLNEYLSKLLDVPISKIVTLGYPRNDLLFINDNSLKRMDLEHFSKTIIWMPTYRKHMDSIDNIIDGKFYKYGVPLLTEEDSFCFLNEKLKYMNICLLIKLHPAQKVGSDNMNNKFSNIKFINDNDLFLKKVNLYNLLGEVDALLTDYSSVYFDYLLVNKPIGLVIDDINEYKTNRGFIVPNYYDYVKGEYILKFQDLIHFIDNIKLNKDVAKNERNELTKKIYNEISKNSTAKVTNFILGIINNDKK